MTFQEFCEKLEAKIINTYEEGATQDEAERLASEFLAAQIRVSNELRDVDLDSRMKKSGLKAARAAAYMTAAASSDKKPTEAAIQAIIDTDKLVCGEQDKFDKADAERAHLDRYFDVFKNAHIHFRGVSKGRFD